MRIFWLSKNYFVNNLRTNQLEQVVATLKNDINSLNEEKIAAEQLVKNLK